MTTLVPLLFLLPRVAEAQRQRVAEDLRDLPLYAPINPLMTSRSGLYFQPIVTSSPGWHGRLTLDYASSAESAGSLAAPMTLDGEFARLSLQLTKPLSGGQFLLIGADGIGQYNGFLDPFLNWYHKLTGLRVAAREQQPVSGFSYVLSLPDGRTITREHAHANLGDVRVGLGRRSADGTRQTLFSATLPTTTGSEGYGRGVVSLNWMGTVRRDFKENSRWMFEASSGFGWTPKHGDLKDYQKSTFVSVSSGVRWRALGQQSLYINTLYQSAPYHDTRLAPMDKADLTLDFGGILRMGKRGPDIVLGMTEDLIPSGPALDLGLRLGVRW